MRIPGVTFESAPPPSPDVLPRMDVAAFVGFAESGPVDVPVAIEDFARFRDVFGGDPELAFDERRGESHRGYLAATVEAFLGGGGRRCWVVRVADAPDLATLELPGLSRLSALPGALDAEPAFAYARSPGVWANGLRAHTMLREEPVVGVPHEGGSPVRITGPADAREISVRVERSSGSLEPGSVLRVTSARTDLQLFVVVRETAAFEDALIAVGAEWVLARVTVPSAPFDDGPRSPSIVVEEPAALGDGPSSPWSSPELAIERLSLDLSVWRGHELVGRIERLGFSPRDPRFWGNLPSDDDLYYRGAPRRPDGRDEELRELWEQAAGRRGLAGANSSRRFPLAGRDPAEHRRQALPLYLPNGMSRKAVPGTTFTPSAGATSVERSGLDALRSEIFVDERLRHESGDSLVRAADLLHGRAREDDRKRPEARPDRPAPGDAPPNVERLRGIHALLSVEESTLIGVPDAVHPTWSRESRRPDLLAHAELRGALYDGDELVVRWAQVEGATSYRLEVAPLADFAVLDAAFEVLHDAQGSGQQETAFTSPEGCQGRLYVRMHALRDAEPSAWSNTLLVQQAAGGFLPCDTVTADVELGLSLDAATGVASWSELAGAVAPGAAFELETARDPLFLTDAASRTTRERRVLLPTVSDGPVYLRVRAVGASDAATGPWSNTAVYVAPMRSRPVLAGHSFDPALLLAIHRSLLRLCHARGDVLGLLTLPRAFGPLEARAHVATLVPTGSSAPSRGAAGSPRPLTFAEQAALSYGALFFPWPAHRSTSDAAIGARFIPADGVVAGQLARTSLERGAWIASANHVLPNVLALEPALLDEQAAELVEAQVNVIHRIASGFVVLDDQTLGRDKSTRSISVRRLLILLKRVALRAGNGLVFEPNDADLHERVFSEFERLLSGLHQRGALRGTTPEEAFRVVADASVNTPQSVDNGRLVVELRVAPSEPLKFLRVRLVQSGPQQVSVGEA